MRDKTQISNELRPPCSRCRNPLLRRSVNGKPRFELRIYYCASCAASDRSLHRFRGGGSGLSGSAYLR